MILLSCKITNQLILDYIKETKGKTKDFKLK